MLTQLVIAAAMCCTVHAFGGSHDDRLNAVSSMLHDRLCNPGLEAAVLANFDRETGGTFDHTVVGRTGGYGLPQYTGAALRSYRAWLLRSGRADSAKSQIDYFVDEYMPTRVGYRTYVSGGRRYTKEQYADWLHRRVFTPAHTIRSSRSYSVARIRKATMRHNSFMRLRIRSVDGVWVAS